MDVSLRRDGAEAVIEVSDNGPGIPPEDREKVLRRFVRLNQTDVTGSGLGLAIVRETVGMHAGSLLLEDTPGGGLTVRIRLPMGALQP